MTKYNLNYIYEGYCIEHELIYAKQTVFFLFFLTSGLAEGATAHFNGSISIHPHPALVF